MSSDDIDWPRFWSPRGEPPWLDDGFLGHLELRGFHHSTKLRELAELREVPCLFLLGEPGMGKSHTLARACRAAGSRRGADTRVLLVDLKYQHIGEHLLHHPLYLESREGAHTLELFLDSLDESRDPQASASLVAALQSHPVDHLRLRIACRTGAAPIALESALNEIWRASSTPTTVQAYELAPLRTSDVREAARRYGVDPEAFMAAVRASQAGPLAARPFILLNFLLRAFKERGRFPDHRWDLYSDGCLHLCEDPSRTRADAGTRGALNAQQRLTIARRMAAACVLGHRNELARSAAFRGTPEPGAHVSIVLDELTGTEDLDGVTLDVTPEALREVVEHTQMFTARDTDHLAWNHWYFAEFLTAWFLAARRLEDADLAALLFPVADAGVPLPLHAVAAELLARRPRLFDLMTERDLSVALRGDVRAYTAEQRARLVEQMLMRADRREFTDDLPLRDIYPHLRHPGLEAQLDPWIGDKGRFLIARRIAIQVARACGLAVLAGSLLAVALDPHEDLLLRNPAIHALSGLATPQQRARLKALLSLPTRSDPQDELLGSVLDVLWPDHITTAELLAALRPPSAHSFLGSFATFLMNDFVPGLSDVDIPQVFAWLTAHADALSAGTGLEDCCAALLERAWSAMNDPGVVDAVTAFARLRFKAHEPLTPRALFTSRPVVGPQPLARRTFLAAFEPLVAQADPFVVSIYLQKNALLCADDIPWLLGRLGGTPSAQPTLWTEMLARFSSLLSHDDPAWEGIVDYSERHPALRQALRPVLGYIELGSREAELHKRSESEAADCRQRSAYHLDPPPEHWVLAELEQIESGSFTRTPDLYTALSLREDGRYDLSTIFVANFPGWTAADAALRARIVDASKQYLQRIDPPDETSDDTGAQLAARTGASRALYLVFHHDPTWLGAAHDATPERPRRRGQAFWSRWIPTLLAEAASPAGPAPRARLLGLAYCAHPDAFRVALRTKLATPNNFQCEDLDVAWDADIAALLLDVVQRPTVSAWFVGSAVGMLARRREPALLTSLSLLVPPNTPKDGLARARAVAAARALFVHDPEQAWPHLSAVFANDRSFSDALFEDYGLRFADTLRAWTDVSSERIVDIYLWLVDISPPAPPSRGRGGRIGGFDSILAARTALRDVLVRRPPSEAHVALTRILAARPDLHEIAFARIDARTHHATAAWRPLRPAQVLALHTRWRRIFDPHAEADRTLPVELCAARLLGGVFGDIADMRRWLATLPDADELRRVLTGESCSLEVLIHQFVERTRRTHGNDASWLATLADHPRAHAGDVEFVAARWRGDPPRTDFRSAPADGVGPLDA